MKRIGSGWAPKPPLGSLVWDNRWRNVYIKAKNPTSNKTKKLFTMQEQNYYHPSPTPSYGSSEEASRKERQQWPCGYEGCGVVLYSKSSRFRHQKLHEKPETQYKCKECTSSFLMKLDLIDHERRMHMSPNSYVVCEECDRTFSSVSNLNAHKEIHVRSASPKHVCRICNVSYFHKSALHRHQRNDHGHVRNLSGSSASSIRSSSPQPHIKQNKSYYNPYDRSQTITPPSNSCLFCSQTFSSDYEYHQHLGAIHYLSSSLSCIINQCNHQVKDRAEFALHKRQHPHFH